MATESNLKPPHSDPVPVDVIRGEKDFYLEKLELIAFNGKSYDITLHYNSLNYHEDLFNSYIMGSVELHDSIDYPELMPLIGEEKIKVILKRQDEKGSFTKGGFIDESLEYEFRVYKIDAQEPKNEKSQAYILYFVSPEMIKNLKTKVYRSWNDTLYSDMVAEIFAEKIDMGKPIEIETTKYEMDFSVSNLSPFEMFNMLASRSISEEGNGEAYVFFEDRLKFNYVTIGKLFKGPITAVYTYIPRHVYDPKGITRKNYPIEIDINNAFKYNWHSKFDVLKQLETGMYGNYLTTIDPVRQKFEFIEFHMDAEWKSFIHADSSETFTPKLDAFQGPLAHTKLMLTNKDHDIIGWIAGREPGIKPWKYEEYVQRRTSHMNQINQYRIGMTVSGDPRRKVGQMVEFDLKNLFGDTSEKRPQEDNKYLSGKYLILSITHSLSKTGYEMSMELMKDAFKSTITHVDPVGKYKPIY